MSDSEGNYLLPLDIRYSITAFMSSFAALGVVIFGVYTKIYQQYLGKMVLTVNSANLFYYIIKVSGFFIKPESDIYCKVIIGFARCAITLSLISGSFFGHAFYFVTKNQDAGALVKVFNQYIIIATTLSAGIGAGIAFSNFSSYSDTSGTCEVIQSSGEGDAINILLIVIPTTLCALLSVIWFSLSSYELKKKGLCTKISDTIILQVYPSIIFVCWLPLAIALILKRSNFAIQETGKIVLSNLYQIQGLFDALAYFIAPKIQACCGKRIKTIETEICTLPDIDSNKQDDAISRRLSTDAAEEYL